MTNPVSKFASLMWNRSAARRGLKNGRIFEWADCVSKIGDDKSFRAQLAGHDIRYLVRSDVADGYSHWVNPVFEFIRPDAGLLKHGQEELHTTLTALVVNNPVTYNTTYFTAFALKAKDWSLFAPALDDNIVAKGMQTLLGMASGCGAGELASAVATYRPELNKAALEGLTAGAPGLFQRGAIISNYPYVLNAMSGAPELKAALEAHPAAQAFVGFAAHSEPRLNDNIVLEANAERGVLVHDSSKHGLRDGPVRLYRQLNEWLTAAAADSADMRPALVFEGLSALAKRPDAGVREIALTAQAEARQAYEAYKLSPALTQRIAATFE